LLVTVILLVVFAIVGAVIVFVVLPRLRGVAP